MTRTLYTVAFPALSAADRRHIDTLRGRLGPLGICARSWHTSRTSPSGSFESPAEAGSLRDRLNAKALSIEGVIDALSVGSLQEDGFRIHATYPLRPAAILE